MASQSTGTSSTTSSTTSSPSPNLGDVRGRIVDLLKDIPKTYQDLINAGRQQEALQLRDAQERLAALGSRAGVSSTERVSILNDMRNAMRSAAGVIEGRQQTDRLSRTESALGLLAGLDERTFNQSMIEFRENTKIAETAAANAPVAKAPAPGRFTRGGAVAAPRRVSRPAARPTPTRLRPRRTPRPIGISGDQAYRAQVLGMQNAANLSIGEFADNAALRTNNPTLTPSPTYAPTTTLNALPGTRPNVGPQPLQATNPNQTGYWGAQAAQGSPYRTGTIGPRPLPLTRKY